MLKISSKSAHDLLSNGWISDLDILYGDPDRHPNLITCFFYYLGSLHKIWLQSVHNFFE